MSNELTDVCCPCGAEFQADSYDAGFIAGSGMCQNCDAALPPKDICTCPSGDGSLVHPCPAHPAPVEHAGGDERDVQGAQGERQAFEAHESRERRLSPADQKFWFRRGAVADYDIKSIDDAWKAWKARAALAQPALQCKKCGGTGDADSGGIHPWGETAMVPCDCAHTERAQGKRTEDGDTIIDRLRLGGLTIDGDNAYKRDLLDCVVGALAFGFQGRPAPEETHWLHRFWEIGNAEREARAALAQPSPAPELNRSQASAVVRAAKKSKIATLVDGRVCKVIDGDEDSGCLWVLPEGGESDIRVWASQIAPAPELERPEVVARVVHSNPVVLGQCGPLNANDELMTVAQHAASVARWAEMFNRVEQQRDAALARVASLESKLAELEKQDLVDVPGPDEIHQIAFEEGQPADDGDGYLFSAEEFDLFVQRLLDSCAAPVAQAQQLHDLDKQCRDDVARALGLRPSQERGFAWSYLLASIKSCVKASEDAAQAQHSVPERLELTDDLKNILGRPNFTCTHLAQALRQIGFVIDRKAEAEQAACLHWMLNHYLANGANWKVHAEAELKAAAPGKEVGHE